MAARLVAWCLALCLLGVGSVADAEQQDFASWLAGVRSDALALGIRPATLDKAFAGVQPIPRVLELDRRQPERVLGFADYVKHVVNPTRIAEARRKYAENRRLLDEIGGKYRVQPRFIVALWGIESDFGQLTGGFSVIGALATLAYDGRRSAFFRGELMAALKILDRGEVTPEAMLGSWAGAMGQSQFMPSSYLLYAVDWRGDGRRDIWHSREDVFASIANYLSSLGWQGDQGWGRSVRAPADLDPQLIGLATRKSIAEWRAMGVRRRDGGELAGRDLAASLLVPGGPEDPALLVYDNFRALLKWNNSTFFAAAVGYLADSMEEGYPTKSAKNP